MIYCIGLLLNILLLVIIFLNVLECFTVRRDEAHNVGIPCNTRIFIIIIIIIMVGDMRYSLRMKEMFEFSQLSFCWLTMILLQFFQ
jgi:hypothetical protein